LAASIDIEPFGTPEGHRSDLEQLREDFVEFSPRYAGLSLRESDIHARVIVGKKGAGKTVYLRRAQAFAMDAHNLYADDSPHEPPATVHVVKVGELFSKEARSEERLVETWGGIWKAAVLRSLVTQLCYSPELATPATIEVAESIWRDYEYLCPHELDPLSTYSQVRGVIDDECDSRADLERYITHRHWEAIEYRVSKALLSTRPVCIYLDAIDEEYRHAPHQWLACQKGLFYQVMRFLRNQRLGSRLHILICIRDHVYASVLESEHLTRYLSRKHIRRLDWNWGAVTHLLTSKVARLADHQLVCPEAEQPIKRWLGSGTIRNRAKGCDEVLLDYLLRHTRLIPRDVVIVANMLAMEVHRARLKQETEVDPIRIAAAVSSAAMLFGKEQLAICGNHLAADTMPPDATVWDGSDLYTGATPEEDRWLSEPGWGTIRLDEATGTYVYRDLEDYDGDDAGFLARKAYQRTMVDHLRTTLKALETDRFDRRTFADVRGHANEFAHDSDVMSILWQGGLLGYIEGDPLTDQPIFFGDRDIDSLRLDTQKPGYAVHPCLVDCVGLRGVGNPIEPHRERR
jgi:hypothetical protein